MRAFRESGVSPVVGAMLVIALVVAAFSIIYVVWDRHAAYVSESEHVERVWEAFSELKSRIRSLENGRSATLDIPMSAKPGTFPFPFIPGPIHPPVGTPGGEGLLQAENEDNGKILFASNNRVFPDQTIIYEQGAVIAVQGEDNSMLSPPALVFARDAEGDNIEVRIEEYHVASAWGRSASGPLTIRIKNMNTYYLEEGIPRENVVLTLKSAYLNAWWDYFEAENRRLAERGFNPSIEEVEGGIRLTILGKIDDPGTNDVFCYWKVTELEIGVGLEPVE